MSELGHDALRALLMAASMFWQVGWSLVLGFVISAMLQALVSRDRIVAALGRGGAREVALATMAGAASSSCSYAAAAVTRTLFTKGAALGPSLAFLFASTNLVVELGAALLLLMGWQFTLGEWLGGVVLVAILSVLVRVTASPRMVAAARAHAIATGGGHSHGSSELPGGTVRERLRQRDTWIAIAQNFASDWRMLWRDLLLGFVIAGALAAFVPGGVWRALFVTGAHPILQVPANALLGPLVAVLSFVCSIGNVPMAAVLWGSGVSFGGVLAFLFADLLVLAAARCVSPQLRMEDGGLSRPGVLRDHRGVGDRDGRGVLDARPRAAASADGCTAGDVLDRCDAVPRCGGCGGGRRAVPAEPAGGHAACLALLRAPLRRSGRCPEPRQDRAWRLSEGRDCFLQARGVCWLPFPFCLGTFTF